MGIHQQQVHPEPGMGGQPSACLVGPLDARSCPDRLVNSSLIEDALAALRAGELTELATVDEIFCGLFWACELVNDVPRADQWMGAAAERTGHGRPTDHSNSGHAGRAGRSTGLIHEYAQVA
jgi:hypothetical protein